MICYFLKFSTLNNFLEEARVCKYQANFTVDQETVTLTASDRRYLPTYSTKGCDCEGFSKHPFVPAIVVDVWVE
jgi:hypothetical protein